MLLPSGSQGRRCLVSPTPVLTLLLSRYQLRLALVLGSANHLSSPIHKVRVGVVDAIASSYQQTLQPQPLRSLLTAKSEHAPLDVSHRSSPPPAQWPLSRSRPQVLASGDPHGYQGGVLSRRPHPLRGFLSARTRALASRWCRPSTRPMRWTSFRHSSPVPLPGRCRRPRWKARTSTSSCRTGWTTWSSPWPVREGQRSQTR